MPRFSPKEIRGIVLGVGPKDLPPVAVKIALCNFVGPRTKPGRCDNGGGLPPGRGGTGCLNTGPRAPETAPMMDAKGAS